MHTRPEFLLLALGLISASCFAQIPADVGVVTFVSGEVRMLENSGGEFIPKPFARVRANERFTLRSGATLRLLYFQSGNSELWTGPAEFTAGSGAHNSVAAPAQVQRLPVKARAKLQIALRLSNNEQLGGTSIRSIRPGRDAKLVLDANQLAEIREMYSQLRKQFPDNDITPEVFLSLSMQQYLSGN